MTDDTKYDSEELIQAQRLGVSLPEAEAVLAGVLKRGHQTMDAFLVEYGQPVQDDLPPPESRPKEQAAIIQQGWAVTRNQMAQEVKAIPDPPLRKLVSLSLIEVLRGMAQDSMGCESHEETLQVAMAGFMGSVGDA